MLSIMYPVLPINFVHFNSFCSGFLPSRHDATVLRRWVEKMSAEIKLDLHCTQKMMGIIWKHTDKVCYQVKKLLEGDKLLIF